MANTGGGSNALHCWFVVNGVPIRYSMREHALITSLDCHEYDSDFNEENFGSYDFVERVFGSKTVKVSQVRTMFESMDGECNGDRLQVAVLYFLSTIIRGRRKCQVTPKRKLKPSMLISDPYTQEKNKEKKHNTKDDKKKEKK